MRPKFSVWKWLHRIMLAGLSGGTATLILQKWTAYQLTGHFSLSEQDAQLLREALEVPQISQSELAVGVALLFASVKALRNYARNHPRAPQLLKAAFGDNTN